MSGWNEAGEYEVSYFAMQRWHGRAHGRTGVCWCEAKGGYSEEALVDHLRESGFEVEVDYLGYATLVAGPGIVEGTTDGLYAAVTGRPGTDPAWGRRPNWRPGWSPPSPVLIDEVLDPGQDLGQ